MEPAMASQGPQPQPALAAPLRQPGGASIDPLNPGERLALQVGEEGPWRRPLPDPPRWVWRLASNGLAAVRSDEGRLLPQAVLASAGAGLEPNPKASPHWEPGGEAAPPLVLVHDPWRPVPGRGGHLGLDAGVVCREDLDRRADVACFSTAPLSTALLLQGVPRLAIAVAADQPGFDLSAALSLLLPDGRALQISTGTARFLGDHCLLQRRRRVDLQPLLRQVLPGQRLRLSLAAAAWPQVAVNPGDGRQPTGAVGVGHRQISLSFDLNRSRLWLTALFGAN